ncbi:hypothetical protein BGT96224_A20066 [Blumeria graminis f. sp. tritici 96224]|uniref:Uncharacterized protein n=1 Tax=Blumeria graminis f. sp. tritici 96224 TaxID=1268274 RepID=A0A656KN82_BLUGR|nr:hypothetical protein BGT96224_A20066 [Blumeria graminis f. sp. tritici 96224]
MKLYLRAASVQFMSAGPGTSAPAYPPRPAHNLPRESSQATPICVSPLPVVRPKSVQPTIKPT